MADERALPATLRANPQLDRWARFNRDGTLTVRTGKAELGQGIKTAMTLIAADELDVDPSRIRLQTANTDESPNEMITAGSMSVEVGGAALRQAMAQVRRILLAKAAAALGVVPQVLRVQDGVIGGAGANRSVSYWDLQAGEPFGVHAETFAPEKLPADYRWVGKGMPRVDLLGKLRGDASFVHDLTVPGLLHGRVVRAPTPHHRLLDEDDPGVAAVIQTATSNMVGAAKWVRRGSFVAVMTAREEHALTLKRSLEATLPWRQQPADALPDDLTAHLKANETHALLLIDGTPVDDPVPPLTVPGRCVQRVSASYSRPFIMHGAIGPSAACALWDGEQLQVWSSSQGVEILKGCLAKVLNLPAECVHVQHSEGAGCYGHNGADDVALDAALAAMAVPGQPVLMKWTRKDEHLGEPYGPAMVLELTAGMTGDGEIAYYSHDVWSYPHSGRPTPMGDGVNMRSAWLLDPPVAAQVPRPGRAPHGGIHRNADPLYAFAERRVVKRFCAPAPLRTSSLRGLGAFANVFAIESFMDEVAHASGQDPVALRLRHLRDPRAQAVIERAHTMALARALPNDSGDIRHGRGLAFAQYKNRQCYAAVVVDVEVNTTLAAVRLLRAYIAADAGCVVDPDGLINQLEGGFIQGASWTLKEAVRYDREQVLSVDWDSYPILRFDEVPEVRTELIDHPALPSLGAGEATQGPSSASIANAVFAACGIRVRNLPLTADALREAAAASGT